MVIVPKRCVKCPRCQSLQVRVSGYQSASDWLREFVGFRAIRCERCLNRFTAFAPKVEVLEAAPYTPPVDALALRPTVLLALALKDANEQQKIDLKDILAETSDGALNHRRIDRLREIFRACDVFEKAEFFVERSREKAEALVADVEDEQIRDLLQFFIETVLARELPPTPLEEMGTVVVPLGSRSLSPALPVVSAPVELRIPELSAR